MQVKRCETIKFESRDTLKFESPQILKFENRGTLARVTPMTIGYVFLFIGFPVQMRELMPPA